MDEFLAVGRVYDGVIAICHIEARTLRIASANNRSLVRYRQPLTITAFVITQDYGTVFTELFLL
jgi:hypothetical protein